MVPAARSAVVGGIRERRPRGWRTGCPRYNGLTRHGCTVHLPRVQDATSRKTEAPDPDTRRAGAARAVRAGLSGLATAGAESTDREQLPRRSLKSRQRETAEGHGADCRQM